MRRCPLCKMLMYERDKPYCIYCRRMIAEAQAELDDWLEPDLDVQRRSG